MDFLRKIIITMFGFAIAVVLGILVMINGWGLEPKSYWWIIGVGFCGQVLASIITRIAVTD